MTSPGVELATEWVTLLPETAQLVKKMKEFKPPPIDVELRISKSEAKQEAKGVSAVIDKTMTEEAKKTGKKVGEGILPPASQVKADAAKTGQTISREVIKPVQKVRDQMGRTLLPSPPAVQKAARETGEAIKKEVVKKAEEAGEASGTALAKGIERKKQDVAKAERSVADARRNEANIDSRIKTQEEKIRQYRKQTEKGAQELAAEEQKLAQMRASAADHSADEIAKQEGRISHLRDQQEARQVRMNAAIESGTRLENSRAGAQNRTANALDNLNTREAALATALSLQNDDLDDNNKKLNGAQEGTKGLMGSLIPLGKQMLVTSGIFTGALGVGGLVTDILRTGNQFNDSLNTIRGITRATAPEMAAMSQKARELGRDMQLPMATANGAANAMLELTKAGFTVQQSMDAVRGSLQLAAAANIDEAKAAEITGTTLNAFGLDAKDAGMVVDVLANAANEFPGEMTDFGYSLSQAGAVAKSFGIDLKDTTTALGFLAQAGIKSSDAGTLIKTMLLSLTDGGKPAQAAIKELGLELYDQQGRFKGIEYVFKRLTVASKEMTQEQYQAATATLFGTDAARFSGLAAGASADEWDKFRKAMDRTGSAADVSNARMEGMPGAIEMVKNSWQSLALTIYDMVKGPLTAILKAIANVILKFDEWLRGPIIQFMKDFKEELIAVGTVMLAGALYKGVTALGALMAAKLLPAIKAIIAATRSWTAAQAALSAAFWANPVGLIVLAIAAVVAAVIYAYKHWDGFRKVVDTTWKAIVTASKWAWENVLKPVFSAIGTAVMWVWNNVLKPFGQWFATSAWPAITAAAQVAWNVLKTIFTGIGTAAKWTWETILQPVFKAIKVAWDFLWFGMKVGWEVGKIIFNAIGDVVMWLWNKVFSPAFQGIGMIVGHVWNFLKEVFEGWKIAFQTVGDAAKWLWHTVLEPVWEAIKSGFKAVWDFLKPLFDLIGKGIEGIGTIAGKIADGIKAAWNGIAEVFKAPLRGLGALLVALPDSILGVDIPYVKEIRGFGAKMAGMRTGGVIDGPGTGTSDSILALANGIPTVRVSAGEGIVRADVMATPLGKMLFELLNSGKLPAFNTGGTVPGGRGDGLNPGAAWLKDYIMKNYGVTDIGGGRRSEDGYGEHSSGNAMDIMVGNNTALGNQIAGFLKTNKDTLGIDGMIWQQRSYGYGGGWNGNFMGDRGNPTQNHMDHLHVILGKGRGASAPAVGLPSGPVVNPTTGLSTTPGSPGQYGSQLMSSSGSGGYVVDPKAVSRAQDRVTDRQNQLDAAQMRLDEHLAKREAGDTVKESTIETARNQVEKFQRELDQAKAELEEAKQGKYKEGKKSKSGSGEGDQDWESVGGMIFSGFMESIGLDGSLFSNPFEWPTVKSVMAGINAFAPTITGQGKIWNPDGTVTESSSNGGIPAIGGSDGGGLADAAGGIISGIGDPMGLQSMAPPAANDMALTGATPQAGPTFDMRGSQLGVSPAAFEDKMGEMTAANRRHPTLGPQG